MDRTEWKGKQTNKQFHIKVCKYIRKQQVKKFYNINVLNCKKKKPYLEKCTKWRGGGEMHWGILVFGKKRRKNINEPNTSRPVWFVPTLFIYKSKLKLITNC